MKGLVSTIAIRPQTLLFRRLLRSVFGAALAFFFFWNLYFYDDRIGSDLSISGYWIGVVISWWYFSDLVVVGFGRSWGRWPQIGALVVIDLAAYGDIWDLPLAWGIFLFTEFVLGVFALSFFLAAAVAVPG